ncbi:MAG: MmgE/PrpD family protein [Waterburya sp.]
MTKANLKTENEFSQLVEQLTHLAQEGLNKEIATHKANGHPIFYSYEGISIMELPDGRRFEYKLDESGIEKIIRSLP